MKPKVTGAKLILNALEHEGVKHIFGIPGLETLPLFNEIIDSNIQVITTTHESGASFMSDAFSRVTDKIGVCTAMGGPGITNILTGIAEAFLDSSPMIILIPNSNNEFQNKHFRIHEINNKGILKHVTKKIFQITNINEISHIIANAFHCAKNNEPGPVAIEINTNIFEKTGEIQNYIPKTVEQQISKSQLEIIKSIIKILNNSSSIGLYIGAGAYNSTSELIELSKKYSAPISSTISGKGIIPEDYELSVGFGFGPSGTKIAQNIFDQCETILAIGCKFDELSTSGYSINIPKNLIHIDINPNVLNKNYPTTISLCMDAKLSLHEILSEISTNKPIINLKLINKIKKMKENDANKIMQYTDKELFQPERFFFELRKLLDRNAIITTDCGNHQYWAINSFQSFTPKSFITPTNFQSMGFGIPAAISAKFAFPEKQVICICGDGGFRMNGLEILTAVKYKLDPIIFIFNNGTLGLLELFQKLKYSRAQGFDILTPNFKLFSESCNANYYQIIYNSDIVPAIENALSSKRVSLIEIKINNSCFPPYQKGRIKAHFSTSTFSEKINMISKKIKNQIKNNI